MKYLSNETHEAWRGLSALDRTLAGLHGLLDEDLVDEAEYRNLAARFLNLKAQLLHVLGRHDEGDMCGRLAAAQFAHSAFFDETTVGSVE